VARRLWPRAAPDPAAGAASSLDPVDRSRTARLVLWTKVAVALAEVAIGLSVLGLGVVHVNIGTWAQRVALRELQQDPGDFVARHVIANLRTLTHLHEVVDGTVLALYGALKGGVVFAVLRHHHRVAIIGAVLFTLVALGAAVVLLRHPTALRAILGVLDVAVAFVMCREAASLRRHVRT
jgi:uncharacterized membrane protein